jgi:hypothetical protein
MRHDGENGRNPKRFTPFDEVAKKLDKNARRRAARVTVDAVATGEKRTMSMGSLPGSRVRGRLTMTWKRRA